MNCPLHPWSSLLLSYCPPALQSHQLLPPLVLIPLPPTSGTLHLLFPLPRELFLPPAQF